MTAQSTMNVTITAIAPVINGLITGSTSINSASSGSLASASYPPGVTFAPNSSPRHGTVVVNPDGSYT